MRDKAEQNRAYRKLNHCDAARALIIRRSIWRECSPSTPLGRRQAVRHRFLVPAFPGSNPGAPAIFSVRQCSTFFRAPIAMSGMAPIVVRVLVRPGSKHGRFSVVSPRRAGRSSSSARCDSHSLRPLRYPPPKYKTRQRTLAGLECLHCYALGNQLAGVAGFSCLAPPRNSSHQLGPSARLWSPRRRIERMT